MGKRDQAATRDRVPGATVCVSGITGDCTKMKLQEKFGDFGDIVRLEILMSKQIAFVEFEDEADARTALRRCDGTTMGGHKITCKIADESRTPEFSKGSKGRGREHSKGGASFEPERLGTGSAHAVRSFSGGNSANKAYIEELGKKSSLRSAANRSKSRSKTSGDRDASKRSSSIQESKEVGGRRSRSPDGIDGSRSRGRRDGRARRGRNESRERCSRSRSGQRNQNYRFSSSQKVRGGRGDYTANRWSEGQRWSSSQNDRGGRRR